MPLINCPDCGHQVSDQAPACPSCGRPIASKTSSSQQKQQPKQVVAKEGCFLQTLNAGCIIIAVIVGLIFLLFFIGVVAEPYAG